MKGEREGVRIGCSVVDLGHDRRSEVLVRRVLWSSADILQEKQEMRVPHLENLEYEYRDYFEYRDYLEYLEYVELGCNFHCTRLRIAANDLLWGVIIRLACK